MATLKFDRTFLKLTLLFLCPHVAVVSTVTVRFIYRKRTRQVWWDDVMVFVAVLANFVYYTALWSRVPEEGPLSEKGSRTAVGWVSVPSFIIATWVSRLSTIVCITRILRRPGNVYRGFLGIAGLFMATSVSLLLHFIILCSVRTAWRMQTPFICFPNQDIADGDQFFVATEIIGNVFVVLAAVRILYDVPEGLKARRIIYGGYVVLAISSVLGIVLATLFLVPKTKDASMRKSAPTRLTLTSLMAALAILISNLIVIPVRLHENFQESKRPSTKRRTAHRPRHSDFEAERNRISALGISYPSRLYVKSSSGSSRTTWFRNTLPPLITGTPSPFPSESRAPDSQRSNSNEGLEGLRSGFDTSTTSLVPSPNDSSNASSVGKSIRANTVTMASSSRFTIGRPGSRISSIILPRPAATAKRSISSAFSRSRSRSSSRVGQRSAGSGRPVSSVVSGSASGTSGTGKSSGREWEVVGTGRIDEITISGPIYSDVEDGEPSDTFVMSSRRYSSKLFS